MTKERLELLNYTFNNATLEIDLKISGNKRKIKELVEEQKKLKETKKGIYELLRMAKGEV